jgi:predicted ester cyclase
MMSVLENKQLIQQCINEVVNTGIVDDLEKYLAAEYTEIFDGRRYPIGLAGAKEHILGVRQTYPDLVVTIDHQIAEGEYVASSITARGTHAGEWIGIRPTGKVVTYTGVNIDRIVGGRIVEHGGAANLLGPLLDIGAVCVVGEKAPA